MLLTLSPGMGFGGTFTAFGPVTFPRSTSTPVPFSVSFSARNPATQFTLQVQVVDLASADIAINGVPVFSNSDFNQNVTFLSRPAALQASNVLSGTVYGKPDGTITVTVVGVDNDPPTISAALSPAANSDGWNSTDVTVTFTCADTTSGVAICPPPQTLTTQSAGQVVSGTATDLAGNSASASLTVNIDKGPPSVVVSSPPNGAFRNHSSLTVTGSATDALSGVATVACSGAPASFSGTEFTCAVSLVEGSNSILVEAMDRAGNAAQSMLTVTLDTAPPSVVIASPTSGSTVSASPVTVNGTASDSLSGVSSVSCNGAAAALSGPDFTCEVPVAAGPNTILVEAADAAGNHASQSVTVTLGGAPTPPPNSIEITPSTMALVVDEPRELALVDDYGRSVTGATWSVSDPSVAELSTTGPIILTGKAAGQATITATWQNFTAQAQVTVFAGPDLPQGTVRWSVAPAPGFSTAQILQAQPSANGPDIYSIENGGQNGILVRALTSDGRQKWIAHLGGSASGPSGAASGSPMPLVETTQTASLGYFKAAHPDTYGGVLLQFQSQDDTVVRLEGATGAESWRYAVQGWLEQDWALHPDGGIFVVEEVDYRFDPNSGDYVVLALDSQSGAETFRVPLPPSYSGYRNWGCVAGADSVYPYVMRPGPPMVGPDGSVYLETQNETWIWDWLPCDQGGKNIYENAVKLLQIRPDGSTVWHDVKQFAFEGYVDWNLMTLPHASVAEVIPDGQGGVLAAWTYSAIGNNPDEGYEARVTRVAGSGNTEYTLPFRGWGFCQSAVWCRNDPWNQDYSETMLWPNLNLVLGENGVAFATRWGETTSGWTAKTISFDVATGAVRWTWETPAWFELIAATAGNGLVGEVWLDDGTTRIVRLDSNGVPTYDEWTPSYSYVEYAYANFWLGLGSTDQVSGTPVSQAVSIWDTLMGFLGQRRSGSPYPQLFTCLDNNATCAAKGWDSGTGGPREWVFNGLKALQLMLAKNCNPDSGDAWEKQACYLDTYVFTSSLKDANQAQATRAGFLRFLQIRAPQFYDGTQSTLPSCGSVAGGSCSQSVSADFRFPNQDTYAETITFDIWIPNPSIPPMRTFFHPGGIYPEMLNLGLLNAPGTHDADNVALVFHEALHAYTRKGDSYLDRPNLKSMLGCDVNWDGTYDITLFLMQFLSSSVKAPGDLMSCSEFSGRRAPGIPVDQTIPR